jgi:hypothetical protein
MNRIKKFYILKDNRMFNENYLITFWSKKKIDRKIIDGLWGNSHIIIKNKEINCWYVVPNEYNEYY